MVPSVVSGFGLVLEGVECKDRGKEAGWYWCGRGEGKKGRRDADQENGHHGLGCGYGFVVFCVESREGRGSYVCTDFLCTAGCALLVRSQVVSMM